MRFARPVAPMLRRHKGAQLAWAAPFFGVSLLFWAGAHLSDEPMMPAEVYGAWVTSFPADWWALSIMAATGAWLTGILINGDWRWSPFLRLLGTTWQVCTLGAFALGAMGAQYGDLVTAAGAMFAAAHVLAVRWAIIDCAFALRREAEDWMPY